MKRLVLVYLSLVCLCGCSGRNKELEQGIALRTALLKSGSFSFEADITADYTDKLYQFSLQCQSDEQGNIVFSVTAPESIAGISGRIDSEGGKLTFDDVHLCFDLLADGQLSPVAAPWITVKALRSGYISSAGRDGEGIRLTIDDEYDEADVITDVWTDGTNTPARAEIMYKGRRILTLLIKNAVIS